MKQFLFSIALLAALLTVSSGGPREPVAVSASGQASPSAAPRYTITDLGSLGGSASQAFGINDKGQVVGTSNINPLTSHAFLWDNGTMTNLGDLGGQGSFARDINDAGQVAGTSSIAGYGRAFLWQNGVGMQNLGTLGGISSQGWGINAAGLVVGISYIVLGGGPTQVTRPFLWNGGMQDLGTLGGYRSGIAYDINDAGQVVGGADSNAGSGNPITHAFLWHGAMQDLGTMGFEFSEARAINESGQVVGEVWNELQPSHAFLWQNGAMQDLGIWRAYDINDRGQVVGSVYAAGVYRAVFWENGQMEDLNNLIPANSGWVLSEARAINNKGQIVGFGSINGQTRAFLLTPHLPVLIVPGIAGTYATSVSNDMG